MTTPTGTIKFSDIVAEFGSPTSNRFGNYRVNQTIGGRSWPLDTGVPTTGQIKFSDLRTKTLNVVVDYSGATEYGVDTSVRYNSSGVVVGGFKTLPTATSSTTKKVYHVIRKLIGSPVASTVALTTGSWTATTLNYIIASGGAISGRGGNGGNAGGNGSSQTVGGNGYYGVGASYPCNFTVESGGILQGGFGGGGGGGLGYGDPDGNAQDPNVGGGGGGGGGGLPAGSGGAGGGASVGTPGAAGSSGSLTSGGSGGTGGNSASQPGPRDCSYGGGGGGGGGPVGGAGGAGGTNNRGFTAYSGTAGSVVAAGAGGQGICFINSILSQYGSAAGINANAIRYNNGVVVTVTNNGAYYGGTSQGTF